MQNYMYGSKETQEKVLLGRTTLWAMEKAGKFPQHVQISPRRIGYIRAEVDAWLEARALERAPKTGG
jgi:prophage regulatory protein